MIWFLMGPLGYAMSACSLGRGGWKLGSTTRVRIQSITPVQWSPSKSSRHSSSGESPTLAGILCARCHSYGQKQVCHPWHHQERTPRSSTPLSGSNLYPNCYDCHSNSFQWVLWVFLSNFQTCSWFWKTPELAWSVRGLGQTWQSGGLLSLDLESDYLQILLTDDWVHRKKMYKWTNYNISDFNKIYGFVVNTKLNYVITVNNIKF